jgi:anti-sigma B factor antagonist
MMAESVPCLVGESHVGAVPVSGEIDMDTAPEMERMLQDALDDGRIDLIVDMTECRFIDCTGLGVLVGAANTSRTRGGSITLRAPGRRIVIVRDLAGLHDVLPTEALERAGPEASGAGWD